MAPGTMVDKRCQACGKAYAVHPYRAQRSRFCSLRCMWTRCGIDRRGSKHPQWKGDDATIATGRDRARRWYPRQTCLVCGVPAERHHIDGNTLNNDPSNIAHLCRAHHQEMDGRRERMRDRERARKRMLRRDKVGGTSSRFIGVTWCRRKGKWQAQVQSRGKNRFLGYFADEEEAARARDRGALELFGDDARLNLPSARVPR